MTAAIAPHPFAPSIAMLEALGRLVEADPKGLAMARTLTDCDRDDAVANQLGALLAAVNDDPRAADQRELLDRARAWHASLVEHLRQRRRFVVMAHEHAPHMGTSPDKLLDNPVCAWVAAVPDEEIERSKREAAIRRAAFHGDWKAELDAYRNGTHPLQPARTARADG